MEKWFFGALTRTTSPSRQAWTASDPPRDAGSRKTPIRNRWRSPGSLQFRKMSSGSAYFDDVAIDFASSCATASSRPGETARVQTRYPDEQVFGIDGLELIAMRAICKYHPGGAKKHDLANFLFGIQAPSYQWQNQTEYRLATLKEMVRSLYVSNRLVLRGQRYFPI